MSGGNGSTGEVKGSDSKRFDTVMVPVSEIKSGNRFRKDAGNLEALAQSIKQYGLLQPVGITPERILIYGERRCRAAGLLGWTEIPARIITSVDLEALELEENVERKDFLVSEKVAIADHLKAEYGKGRGGDRKSDHFQKIVNGSSTDEVAAKRAGLGNRETYRQAKKVLEKGSRDLVSAMDSGSVSIATAAELADLSSENQKSTLRKGKKAAIQAAKTSKRNKKKPRDKGIKEEQTASARDANTPIPTKRSDTTASVITTEPSLAQAEMSNSVDKPVSAVSANTEIKSHASTTPVAISTTATAILSDLSPEMRLQIQAIANASNIPLRHFVAKSADEAANAICIAFQQIQSECKNQELFVLLCPRQPKIVTPPTVKPAGVMYEDGTVDFEG